MRLAIDFGGTNLKLGLVDTDASFVDSSEIALENLSPGKEFIAALLESIDHFLAGRQPELVAMASKGGVDIPNALVASDIGAGRYLMGINLRKKFESHYNIPFILDNDARAYALGEYNFGAGKGAKTLVCITLGTGVGSALLQNGKAYYCDDPVGGLLGGHLSIDRNGIPCNCGNRGCLERYVSASALHEIINKKFPELMGTDQDPIAGFFEQANREVDGPLRQELNLFIENLSIGLVNIIHAYGTDTIVIGGGVAKSADKYLPAVRKRVTEMAWTTLDGGVKIKPATLASKAALLGMAFHPFLTEINQNNKGE